MDAMTIARVGCWFERLNVSGSGGVLARMGHPALAVTLATDLAAAGVAVNAMAIGALAIGALGINHFGRGLADRGVEYREAYCG
jgi:hypothetical protein